MSSVRLLAAVARAMRILVEAREEYEAELIKLPPDAETREVPLTVKEMAALYDLTERQIRNLAKAGAGFKPLSGPYKGQWQLYPSRVHRKRAA